MREFTCILVLGVATLTWGADLPVDSEGSESKDIAFKDDGFSSAFEKFKRGAIKISNVDNPSFNHLSSLNSGGSSSNGFKSSSSSSVQPFRYFQNNQYQPFLTYLQPSHPAAQVAAQYSFQATPVTQYLQTPTQVQYVSAPTVAQVPFVKFQNLGGDQSSGSTASDSTQSHQSINAASHVPASSASSTSSSATISGNSPSREFSLYQTPQSLYYTQQPLLAFFVQPQPSSANFLYQQPGLNHFFRQQPHQYLGFHTGNRFGVYPSPHANQVTYLLPMAVSPAQGTQANTDSKSSSSKNVGGNQHSGSAPTFTYGNKS